MWNYLPNDLYTLINIYQVLKYACMNEVWGEAWKKNFFLTSKRKRFSQRQHRKAKEDEE